MKILVVISAFYPCVAYGGPSSVAQSHVTQLVATGHDVTVLTSNVMSINGARADFFAPTRGQYRGADVRYFRSGFFLYPTWSLLMSRDLVRWFKSHATEFDLVHIHFARDWIPIRIAMEARKLGMPYVLQTHGMLDTRHGIRTLVDALVTKRILRDAQTVLALQDVENDLLVALSPKAHVTILPNGIPVSHEGIRSRRKQTSPHSVLFLARLHPRKQPLLFVKMAAILEDRGIDAKYRVVGPDCGELPKMKDLVTKLGLTRRFTFVGELSGEDITNEYLRASAYVLPSVNEPFGLTVLEALSFETPTVITTGVQIHSMLKDAKAALVVPDEPERLADAVMDILLDEELGESLGAHGSSLIASELNIASVVRKLTDIYEKCVARKNLCRYS